MLEKAAQAGPRRRHAAPRPRPDDGRRRSRAAAAAAPPPPPPALAEQQGQADRWFLVEAPELGDEQAEKKVAHSDDQGGEKVAHLDDQEEKKVAHDQEEKTVANLDDREEKVAHSFLDVPGEEEVAHVAHLDEVTAAELAAAEAGQPGPAELPPVFLPPPGLDTTEPAFAEQQGQTQHLGWTQDDIQRHYDTRVGCKAAHNFLAAWRIQNEHGLQDLTLQPGVFEWRGYHATTTPPPRHHTTTPPHHHHTTTPPHHHHTTAPPFLPQNHTSPARAANLAPPLPLLPPSPRPVSVAFWLKPCSCGPQTSRARRDAP